MRCIKTKTIAVKMRWLHCAQKPVNYAVSHFQYFPFVIFLFSLHVNVSPVTKPGEIFVRALGKPLRDEKLNREVG